MCSRNERSKCLWSSLLTITVAACVSLLYFYLENTGKQPKNTSSSNGYPAKEMLSEVECVPVCDNKECVIYANLLLKNMKPDADPCENFNTFACGAYKEQFTKNKEQFKTEVTFSILQDSQINMFKTMNDILRNIEADPDTASGKLKTMYDSCMNLAPMEKNALSTAEKFLSDVGIPDWPNLAPDFQFLGTDIPTIVGSMKGRGELQFLMFAVPNTKTESYNEIHNLTLNMDLRYFNNLFEFQKKSPAVEMLKFFELDDHSIDEIWCDYSSVRKSIINVAEKSCYNVTDGLSCVDDNRTKRTKNKSCGSVCNPFFNEDWLGRVCYEEISILACSHQDNNTDDVCKFIEAFLKNSQFEEDYRINKESITLSDQPFFKNTFQVLKNFSDRAVANFLALNFYLSHIGEMNFYFRRTHYTYFSPKRCEFYKPSRTMARWRDCTEWMIDNMFFAAQYEFVNNYLTLEENDKVIGIFEECKSELAEAVAHQDWLRQEDKEYINTQGISINFENLKKFQSRPLEYKHSVNDYYKKFHPTGKSFLYDAMELRRATPELLLQLSPIDLSLIKEKFENSPFFDDRCDEVVFYFGHITPIHYMPGLPRVMNLLATGVYASHELGHNFDFDIAMDIRNITGKRRKERELCLINQYSKFKYEFEDKNLNGKQFTAENNADSISAFVIDKLIEKYVSADEEILLPGFNYSFKQIAYILTNQIYCDRITDDLEYYFRNELAGHAPSRLRSIGPMQNSKGFSEAFNCPEGSYMNPSTKCAMLDDV